RLRIPCRSCMNQCHRPGLPFPSSPTLSATGAERVGHPAFRLPNENSESPPGGVAMQLRRLPRGRIQLRHAGSALAQDWLELVGAGVDAGLLASVWAAEFLILL